MTRRDDRMRRTRTDLIVQARELALAHGLHGFTVDQLCEAVGISRRTFFNYFASKDDAVIGTSAKDPFEALGEEFVARGRAGGKLLEDLRELILHTFDDADTADPRRLMELLRREPALAERAFSTMERRRQELTELIRRHTGAGADDPFPGLAASVVGHLAGHTMHRFLELNPPAGTRDRALAAAFASLLDEHLDLARRLFAAPACSPVPRSETTTKDPS
ncbi:TetR/AcrR family transcriptional regulator [Tersicoccus solisilvae]|uniref:TetR/AcrR family transcriptional regulator n=1 Tax=Tersicoccus solisilvae TaxID=1882339 RepID=UPI00166C1BA2|nr:TetR/AcrR family transcriptional regulator [Tersicoccus solisilvae]